GTSRCRSSATARAARSRSASASAACSGATRRSSRRRRPLPRSSPARRARRGGGGSSGARPVSGPSAGSCKPGPAACARSQEGELFFLEVNARLQVEHCVTEMCTGIDLVEQQLRIASGERLAPEILSPARRGHAIEARVYAEDPAKKFAPQPGHLKRVSWP